MADRDRADGGPFSYATRADGTIVILYRAAPVTLLRGTVAARFASRIGDADGEAAQLLMARATARVRRGNAGRDGRSSRADAASRDDAPE